MKIYVTIRTTDEAVNELRKNINKHFNTYIDAFTIKRTDEWVILESDGCSCYNIAELTSLQTIIQKTLNTNDRFAIF